LEKSAQNGAQAQGPPAAPLTGNTRIQAIITGTSKKIDKGLNYCYSRLLRKRAVSSTRQST
jgi:hypothetical protein